MTAVDRSDNGQDEEWVDEGCSCGNPSPRTYEHNPSCTLVRCRRCGMDLPDHLPGDDLCRPCTRPHLTSARAGAGEQQREQVVSLDDLRLSPRESRQLHIATLLTAHQPVHNPPRPGDCGPTIACTCGHDRLGDWFSWHVADELLALLDRTQPDDDPGPQCPSTSHGTDGGWRCEHRAGHDGGHRNREVEW